MQVGGVGDRTNNFFDGTWENKFIDSYGNTGYSTNRVLSSYVTVIPGQTCTVKSNMRIRAVHSYNDTTHTQALIDNATGLDEATFTIPANSNSIRISLKKANDGEFTPNDVDWCMLNIGSEALPYEPYGYKVPVVINGKNFFDETQVQDKSVSTSSSNYQIFKQNGKLTINGMTTTAQADTEISNVNDINSQALEFINNNAGNYIFTSSVPGRIMIRYKQNGSDVVRYTFDEYNSSNRVADRIVFRLQQNYQYNNEQMNIMFKLKQIQSDNYEPYHEPTITNIYLNTPIEAKANIPSEYEEVEYIESTGTQYIDTNYTPVQGDDLEFKNVTINTFNGALFSAGIESYQLILLGLGSVCYYKYFQTGNAAASSFSTITNGNIKVLNGNLYINNVLKAQADYGGAVNTTLNIFQRANNTSNLIGKIGEIIISNNGIIKRDFIPCYRKSDNVAGLYDLVNNTFYTNQGTGNFIVGPIKENESISLSDTNTNIQTIRGTNVLTVDTTVQPSNVYVKSRKESQYETAMRENYEQELSDIESALQEV